MQLTLSLAAITVCAHICVAAPQITVQGPPAKQTAGGAPAKPNVDAIEAGMRPNHPPDAGEYLPMPLPETLPHNDQALAPRQPDQAVTYDIRTGRVIVTPPNIMQLLGKARDFVLGSGGDVAPGQHEKDLARPENFGALSKLSTYASYPYRVNVKLFQTFPNNASYVCSGTLIDPSHVITCGHCVFNRSRGGWVKSVFVVPAYNGDASAPVPEPYGRAYGVQLHSWTSYTNYTTYTHDNQKKDIAIIDLGRPVGGITGWHGYGYNTNCSFFTTPTFNNASYPATSPYNGNRMYFKSGDYDSCPNNPDEAQYNGLSYGGQSGSSNYKILGSNRVVYAMLAHGRSTSPIYTHCTRLDSGRFADVGSFILADKPTRFDITPMYTRGPTIAYRGQRRSGLSFLLHNYSRVSTGSRTFSFDVYLSTNTTISTGDTRLGSWNSVRTIPALGSTTIGITNVDPYIPYTIATGTYYIGVIMTSTDGNGKRKSTSIYDVHKISIRQPTPTLTQPTSNLLNNVTTGRFFVGGTGLGNTTRVYFNNVAYTSQSSANWRSGYFVKSGDTGLYFYPPQGRTPGNYSFRAYSGGINSNTVTLRLQRNPTRYLAAPSSITLPANTYLYGSVGTGVSSNTLMQLCFSWSTVSSIAPGFVTLGIGDNWRQLYFGSINLAGRTTGATSWSLGTSPSGYAVLKGRRVYYQCIQADLNSPASVFPLKTTNERSILYR